MTALRRREGEHKHAVTARAEHGDMAAQAGNSATSQCCAPKCPKAERSKSRPHRFCYISSRRGVCIRVVFLISHETTRSLPLRPKAREGVCGEQRRRHMLALKNDTARFCDAKRGIWTPGGCGLCCWHGAVWGGSSWATFWGDDAKAPAVLLSAGV